MRDRFLTKYTPLVDRLAAKTRVTDGCWFWTGMVRSDGYGIIKNNKKSLGAHRVAYQLHVGAIPPGMLVCHHCDNPLCVRPDHLFLGTPKDNMQDMLRKGRQRFPAGEECSRAKLTEEQVRAIRLSDEPHTHLARRYGVGSPTIDKIKHRQTWRHLP